ncbi:MAG TPA: inositol monophosphatase family protein [Planctomycetota bacterium]
MSTELDPLERAALEAFRSGAPVAPWDGVDGGAWTGFGLRCLLEAARVLRAHAGSDARADLKDDGSPVTALERAIEVDVRARLAAFAPAAAFVGEEHGGRLPERGLAVALDPVDGTWGLLSETSTWACVLAVLEDGQPLAGFVANPVTGELAHARRGGAARLLRLSAFGEPARSQTLPTRRGEGGELLVHLHPTRAAEELRTALHAAWRRGEVRVVRSPGGSPAWGLTEAARGHHVYLNAWSREPAEPWDLAAGTLLVRCAGGDVVDAEGAPIDATRHAGPWIAGIGAERLARAVALARGTWPG